MPTVARPTGSVQHSLPSLISRHSMEPGDEQTARYECPNWSALKCDFHTGDLEVLKTHTLAHFCKAPLPRRALCPFKDCGEVFETRVEGSTHNRSAVDALHARTQYVVEQHYDAEERLSREVWDHDLVTHFWKVNVISDDESLFNGIRPCKDRVCFLHQSNAWPGDIGLLPFPWNLASQQLHRNSHWSLD
ncbi:hypothetical protein EJ06DRAFT_281914 [Trichodelitschia bisporula]|uniref:C2H2-type domain-containing protein n=1 Tax=Trichodelitschia bisporula TaxID=703511 RepID=A0A6G1I5E6_9PEZI|nr:hypothetical protein EJ06DRAFT_281914 [Trichodelitschia bisporula]